MATAKEKYEICHRITSDALSKLEVTVKNEISKTLLKFANDYYNDAEYYASKGDYATALEAIAYAHGFIDAGILCGVFEIPGYHLKVIR